MSIVAHGQPSFDGFAPHGREMAGRIAALDAAATPLGAVTAWPATLRTIVGTILHSGAQIVVFWGPDYIAVYNDAYVSAIGDKHPRALGRPARENWSEMWDDLEPLLDGVYRTGQTYSERDRGFRDARNGTVEETFFDISYSPVPLEDGSVGGILCVVSETTDRVRAARAIVEDRARLSEMFDQAPSFMTVLRQPGHVYELANQSYLRLVGRRDLIGRSIRAALPELEGQGVFEVLDAVAATGEPYRGEGEKVALQRTPGGPIEERFADFVFQPVTDQTGAVSAIFVVGSDVTDRTRVQERLALSEESLRLATEAAEIGTWDHDLVRGAYSWSDRTRAMFGIAPDSPGKVDIFYDRLHPDDHAPVRTAFEAMQDPARRAAYDMEYRVIDSADGAERWIAARGRGVFTDGRCVRAMGTAVDITQRKRAAQALRESEERFRNLADSAPALMWIGDARGGLEFVNRWYEDVFGGSTADALRYGWQKILHPDDAPGYFAAFRAAVAVRGDFHYGVRVIDRDGRTRWLQSEGRPRYVRGAFAGYVGCSVDATDVHLAAEVLERRIAERTAALATANAELTAQIEERERVEAALHQMQRLEAVGQLTSGVAHDFNNLLTVVLGNVGMIERVARNAGMDDRTLTRLDHVRTAAERGAALTAQLLAFSRRQRLEAKTIDLNATVQGMRGLLQTSLGNAITVDMRLGEGLWPALVDPTQIELIILNLAINARDAMEVGGDLCIETANVTMGRPQRPEDPPAGDHVMVAVVDSGTGMPAEVLAKAFEPFFTTKPVGKGSGLGLAQVFGFAKQSGGGVRIDTLPGEGTTVRVYLPRSAGHAGAAGIVDTAAAIPNRSARGATVLVVDDEPDVRAVTADLIAELGCAVVEADSGAAALDRLAETHVDLVVADFAMPGMNGAELARRVADAHPALPLLVVTGYADLRAIADVPDAAILQKPYRAADLQARVQTALGR